jgi:tetratricopeptide (TPR) repeat protein
MQPDRDVPPATVTLASEPATRTFEPDLDAALAAAFGPESTPEPRESPTAHAPPGGPSAARVRRAADERYQFFGELARGGMGVVLRGRDRDLGRDLAFKVLRPDLADRPGVVQRFVEEAQLSSQLQHPGIVPVHDLGRFADGRPYFAMKLVNGHTLAALLTDRPNPAADRGRFVRHFLQVCQAVAYAHARGVVHRDLKPANVMVGAFDEVLVMDWGLAKVLPRDGADQPRHEPDRPEPRREPEIRTARLGSGAETMAGSVFGTPAFMPPEQAGGEVERLDERADVFGLGAILCVIVTGEPPYLGETPEAIRLLAARGQLAGCFDRLDRCGADAELIALCKSCLAPARDDRPRDAGAVAGAVLAHLTGVEDRAARAERDRAAAAAAAREQRKRRRVRLGLAAALAVLGLGLGAFFWWQDRQGERTRRLRAEADTAQARLEAQTLVERANAEAAEARAATGVEAALALAAELRTRYRFAEAKAVLDQGAGLLRQVARAGLLERHRRACADLALVTELDAIRMRAVTWTGWPDRGGRFDQSSAPPAYRASLLGHGLDVAGGDPAAEADRVRASAVRAELVAALDDWAVYEPNPETRTRILEVARRADPGEWSDRFRDPAVRASRARLREVARAADPAALAPGTVTALVALMEGTGLDSGAVLRGAQFAHPGDFRIAFALAVTAGTPDAAAAQYRVARAIRADSYAVLNNLAGALLEKGASDEALACLEEAKRLDPAPVNAFTNLGNVLTTKRDWEGALANHREAVRRAPADPRVRYNMGITLMERGDVGAAIASFRDAIRLDPGLARLHINLGVALRRRGDADGAIASFRTAIRLDPDGTAPVARHNLAMALEVKGDLDGAIANYRETIRLDPACALAHADLGNALVARRNPGAAIAPFKEAIRLDPTNHMFHYNLGVALVGTGDRAGAIAAWKEAIRLAPEHAESQYNLGVALSATGRADEAIPCYREAIRLSPGRSCAHFNLGLALFARGDRDAGIAELKEAARLDPGSAPIRYNLGLALGATGAHAPALTALEEAVRLNPAEAQYQFALGNALAAVNDRDGAVGAYRAVLRLDPAHVLAHNNLGAVLRAQGDLPGAIVAFKEAIRLDPPYAQAHNNLGIALLRAGDLDAALPCFREAVRLDPKNSGYRRDLEVATRSRAARDERVAPPPREIDR